MKTRILLLLLVLLQACASAPRKSESVETGTSPESQPVQVEELPHPVGEKVAETPMGPVVPSMFGPELTKPKAVVLVLGPGLARAFSAEGTLKAFKEKNIPIAAVVGTEMGALMGALFACSKTMNEFEWALQKLKPEFFERAGLKKWLSSKADPEKIKRYIEDVFSGRKIQDCETPLYLGVYSQRAQAVRLVHEGELSQTVVAAALDPIWFDTQTQGEDEWTSVAFFLPYPVAEAKQLGLGPVVAVDTLGLSAFTQTKGDAQAKDAGYRRNVAIVRAEGKRALSDARVVIYPEFGSNFFSDFEKKNEMSYAGEQATLTKAQEILKALEPSENGSKP